MKTKINKMILKTVGCVILAAPLVSIGAWGDDPLERCCNHRTGNMVTAGTIDDNRAVALGASTDYYSYKCMRDHGSPNQSAVKWYENAEQCTGNETYRHTQGCMTGSVSLPNMPCGGTQ